MLSHGVFPVFWLICRRLRVFFTLYAWQTHARVRRFCGRLSETKNGNLQLTVIVSKAELEEPGAEICFSAEGCLAAEAAIVFMLRRRLAQDRKL